MVRNSSTGHIMDDLSFVEESVSEAGKIALSYFDKTHTYHLKEGAINFATEADLACEKFIFKKIKKQYPDHSFLSEEMGLVKGKSRYTWVLDPIDGTVNFSRGLPLWGISLALFENTVPISGAIYLPVFDEIYFAQKGKGSFNKKGRSKVSRESDLGKCVVEMGLSYPEKRKYQKLPAEKIYRLLPSVVSTSFCTVYPLICIAGGRMDGFIMENDFIWDIAAGAVIIEEAGGRITDWKGNELEYESDGKKLYQIVASNGEVHKDILGYLK